MGCHFLLQGMFLTQGLNPSLPQCRQTFYGLSHQRIRDSPVFAESLIKWVWTHKCGVFFCLIFYIWILAKKKTEQKQKQKQILLVPENVVSLWSDITWIFVLLFFSLSWRFIPGPLVEEKPKTVTGIPTLTPQSYMTFKVALLLLRLYLNFQDIYESNRNDN